MCGKGPGFGNNVSFSHRRTPRRWNPNIQRRRVVVGGTPKRVNVCTSCIKAGRISRKRGLERAEDWRYAQPGLPLAAHLRSADAAMTVRLPQLRNQITPADRPSVRDDHDTLAWLADPLAAAHSRHRPRVRLVRRASGGSTLDPAV